MHALVTFIAQDLIVISFLALPFAFFKLNKRFRRRYLVFAVLSGLVTYFLSRIASLLHHVPRPFVHDGVVPYFKSAVDNGFPSDHTLIAAFAAFIVLRYFRKAGAGLVVLAAVIGMARVIGNVHHGQDVVGAIVVAAIGVGLGYLLSRGIANIPAQRHRLKLGVFVALAIVLSIACMVVYAAEKAANKPVAVAPHNTYVALGDSVAAGVGLGDYIDSSACDRTTAAYPELLATRQNLALTSVACSGATIPSGILGSQTVNRKAETPQIKALFAQPKTPSLITITIGANDVNWTNFLKQCYLSECGDAADTQVVTRGVAQLASNLRLVLQQISDHYQTAKPRIVVTGYYQLFPSTEPQHCSDLNSIDSSELAWGRQLQTSISTTIATTAQQFPAVTYAPISFAGHELCTTDSWVQSLSDTQPYHPTKAGQAAIAQQITKVLNK